MLPFPGFPGWQTREVTWNAFGTLSQLPDVTMISSGPATPEGRIGHLVNDLAKIQIRTADGLILMHFVSAVRPEREFMKDLLRKFAHPERVELRWSKDALNESIIQDYMAEIGPKVEVLEERQEQEELAVEPVRPSPLDDIQAILATSRELRSESGRLSAQEIARVYDLPVSRLAGWLGRNRQTVIKTPDAVSLQPALEYFERVARLRVRFDTGDFRKWLRVPNALLDGKQPLELLAQGEWQVVADFVDDMLTGNPT
jgi:hypothetical protein